MSDALSLNAAQVEAMPEADAQTALQAWVAARRTELPEALAASKSKVHAKLAKKALYQLKSVGLEVTLPAVVDTVVPVPPSAPEEFPAVLSAILGTGERAIFFARPVRGGGLEVYQGVLSDELGVVQLEGGTSKRGVYRKRMKELESDPTLKVLLVPWERMRLELARALMQTERALQTPLESTMDVLRQLGIEPDPSQVELDAPRDGDDAASARSVSLLNEKELSTWLPSEPAIAALAAKLADLEVSTLVLTPEQKREQASARAASAAAEYLTVERRKVYARRLHATAELFEATKRPEAAELARAEARRLFHTTHPSPFVEAMFLKVVDQRFAALKQAAENLANPAARLSMPGPR